MKKRKYKSRYYKGKSVWKKRWFWDVILGFLFFAGLSYLLFLSPALALNQIKIIDSGGLPGFQVYNQLASELGKSILLIDKSDFEAQILCNFSSLKQAKINLDGWHKLSVALVKREPVAEVCKMASTTNCWMVDETATIFNRGLASVKIDSDFTITKDILAKILKIEQGLLELDLIVVNFSLIENSRFNVLIEPGWQIYFTIEQDLEFALKKLELLLEQEINLEQQKNLKYIDLRFSKVYFLMKRE